MFYRFLDTPLWFPSPLPLTTSSHKMAITKLTYYTKQPKRLMHILLAFDPRILLQLLLLCHVLDFKNLIDWSLSSLMSNEGFYAIVIHYSLTWARNESIFSFLLYYMKCLLHVTKNCLPLTYFKTTNVSYWTGMELKTEKI